MPPVLAIRQFVSDLVGDTKYRFFSWHDSYMAFMMLKVRKEVTMVSTIIEPLHKKTNNMHRQKQRPRSAVQ